LPKAPPDPPKHAEFHLAKRLQREAEELLAGSMSSLRKTWGAAQIVKAAKKGKELKSTVQRNSRRRQRRPRAAPTSTAKTSTGWTPPGDVKCAVEDVERSSRDLRN
jgi:hypothetical protein